MWNYFFLLPLFIEIIHFLPSYRFAEKIQLNFSIKYVLIAFGGNMLFTKWATIVIVNVLAIILFFIIIKYSKKDEIFHQTFFVHKILFTIFLCFFFSSQRERERQREAAVTKIDTFIIFGRFACVRFCILQ